MHTLPPTNDLIIGFVDFNITLVHMFVKLLCLVL